MIVLAVAISAWFVVARSAPGSAYPTVAADVSHRSTPRPSAFAVRTIPSGFLHDYWRAAAEYGLDWTKLAGVVQIESDPGRSQVPGVGAGTNPAGAAGPAQFPGATWARYGVDADGHGSMNPYDPADAITAMAAYLKASGAPEDLARGALHLQPLLRLRRLRPLPEPPLLPSVDRRPQQAGVS